MQQEPRKAKCDNCNRRINIHNMELHLTKCKPRPPKPNKKETRQARKRQEDSSPLPNSTERSQEEKIPCPNCGKELSLADLDTHSNKCEFREMACGYCRQQYPRALIREHQQVCPKLPRHTSPPPPTNTSIQKPETSTQESRSNTSSQENRPTNIIQPTNPLPLSTTNVNPPGPNRPVTAANSRSFYIPPENPRLQHRSQNVNNSTGNNPFLPRLNMMDQRSVNIFTNIVEIREPRPNIFQTYSRQAQNILEVIGQRSLNRIIPNENRLTDRRDEASLEQRQRVLAQRLATRQTTKETKGLSSNQIKLIPEKKHKPSSENGEEEECSICAIVLTADCDVKDLKCKHDFHVKCISDWLSINNTCPLCRTDLSANAPPLPPPIKKHPKDMTPQELARAYFQFMNGEDQGQDE